MSVVAYDVDAVGAEAEEGGGVIEQVEWLVVIVPAQVFLVFVASQVRSFVWVPAVMFGLGSDVAALVVAVVSGEWLLAGVMGWFTGWVAWFLWRYWRRHRRGKRVLRVIGAKSWARLAAVVRKAREAARPRPVLRPAPGGAR